MTTQHIDEILKHSETIKSIEKLISTQQKEYTLLENYTTKRLVFLAKSLEETLQVVTKQQKQIEELQNKDKQDE